jgi:hypothetical protein
MATLNGPREATMSYRYDRFRREHLRDALAFRPGKDPGWQAPDFDLPTTRGGRLQRLDFQGRAMLLTFASLTDPIAASAAPVLKALHREFGDEVAFVTVYVRESHPGERIPQPRAMDWKARHARMFRDREGIPWTVAVDDLEGTLHRAFGGSGASAHLVDARGTVVFQTVLSNDGASLRRALEALQAGTEHPSTAAPRLLPALCGLARTDDVVRAAGSRALDDLRREAPLLYGAAELAWTWRALSPIGRVAVAAVGALGVGAIVGGVTLAARRRFV